MGLGKGVDDQPCPDGQVVCRRIHHSDRSLMASVTVPDHDSGAGIHDQHLQPLWGR